MGRGGELRKEWENKRKGPSGQEGALDRTLYSKAHGLEPTMCPPPGLSLRMSSGGNDFSWPIEHSFPSLSSPGGGGMQCCLSPGPAPQRPGAELVWEP